MLIGNIDGIHLVPNCAAKLVDAEEGVGSRDGPVMTAGTVSIGVVDANDFCHPNIVLDL